MTPAEFKKEYDKLVQVYPRDFESTFIEIAIGKYIMDLEPRWWATLVNRIILSRNPRLDIEDVARGERLARQKVRDTNALIAMSEKMHKGISEAGLDNALKSFGANSLLDAIKKIKLGKQ